MHSSSAPAGLLLLSVVAHLSLIDAEQVVEELIPEHTSRVCSGDSRPECSYLGFHDLLDICLPVGLRHSLPTVQQLLLCQRIPLCPAVGSFILKVSK